MGHDKASIAESIRQSWNTIFLRKHWLRLLHEGSSKKKESIVRIPKILWLTFEQFKDTLVEYQLTLSWWGTFEFLTIGKSMFFTGVVLSAFNLSLSTD